MTKPTSQSIGIDPGEAFVAPLMALDGLRRACASCGTSWNAPVKECPECGGTEIDEIEGVNELAAAMGVRPDTIELIRRDERAKLSGLPYGSAATISAFASDAQSAIELVAYMLTFGSEIESPEQS